MAAGEDSTGALRIYNTLTRREEEFLPVRPGEVRMYVCGPTVYSFAHLGHARPAVVFDVARRYLIYSGYRVRFVSNITDIDDKIIAKANDEKKDISEISRTYTADYRAAMAALGVMAPDVTPLCTEHLPEMIDLVKRILAAGHAYEAESPGAASAGARDVYFDVQSLPGYGKLSRRSIDDETAHRIEPDERKRHPADFALWKASKPREPSWESPWGPGRPGWHIECSAMSHKHLGVPFDIHGGGEDLIFPHHENEIAQAEAGYGTEFARYWMHNGFVKINAEKMSKSLGNVTNLADLLKRYDGAYLRFFILGTHYRSPIDFTPERLDEAKAGLERIYNALEGASPAASVPAAAKCAAAERALAAFRRSMDADFNSAGARAAIFDLASDIHRMRNEATHGGGAPKVDELAAAVAAAREMLGVLGLPTERRASASPGGISDEEIGRLIEARRAARATKDFAEADRIRKELAARGVEIRDLPGGKVEVKRR